MVCRSYDAVTMLACRQSSHASDPTREKSRCQRCQRTSEHPSMLMVLFRHNFGMSLGGNQFSQKLLETPWTSQNFLPTSPHVHATWEGVQLLDTLGREASIQHGHDNRHAHNIVDLNVRERVLQTINMLTCCCAVLNVWQTPKHT